MNWKPDWQVKKRNYIRWWEGKGLVVNLTAPREKPAEGRLSTLPPSGVHARQAHCVAANIAATAPEDYKLCLH